jgi:hypothetical protein
MNAKRAKIIRRRLRESGLNFQDVERIEQKNGRIVIVPECGKSIYRRIKQLGID